MASRKPDANHYLNQAMSFEFGAYGDNLTSECNPMMFFWVDTQKFWAHLCAGSRTQQKFSRNLVWHDDVIKWEQFPLSWPFVRGIHRSPVDSHHEGQWRGALMFFLICAWTRLSKQLRPGRRWLETPSRSLWWQSHLQRRTLGQKSKSEWHSDTYRGC